MQQNHFCSLCHVNTWRKYSHRQSTATGCSDNFVIFLFSFSTASGPTTCYKCEGTGEKPLCNETEICSSTEKQCISSVEKDDGKITYMRGCALPLACTTKKAACTAGKVVKTIEECAYKCCDTTNCNTDFPSFSSGVQVTSGLVAIATTLVFALFVMWTIYYHSLLHSLDNLFLYLSISCNQNLFLLSVPIFIKCIGHYHSLCNSVLFHIVLLSVYIVILNRIKP